MYTGFWQPNMKLASQSSPNKQLRPSCLPGVGLSHRNPLHSLQRSDQRVGDEWNNLQPGRLCDDNPRYSLNRKYFWQINVTLKWSPFYSVSESLLKRFVNKFVKKEFTERFQYQAKSKIFLLSPDSPLFFRFYLFDKLDEETLVISL